MRILVTGANGFIGQNLMLRLRSLPNFVVDTFFHSDPVTQLPLLVARADAVVHLAGVNRPLDHAEFVSGNVDLTQALVDALRRDGRGLPVIYTSSTQAEHNNPYGQSKAQAEALLRGYAAATQAAVHIYRLPNVFGKWCRPNYNSAVATFCHNIARDRPIKVNDPLAPLTLVYIDDVVDAFIQVLCSPASHATSDFARVSVEYPTTVGEVAQLIGSFKSSRQNLVTERVGQGLVRALYATYLSYLPTDAFAYSLVPHADVRGVFVEMLKTPDCGQFSYFTAHPGITRGGHYHHSKNEKFLIVRGTGRFGFRHMVSGEKIELVVSSQTPQIVETIPGWAHDITNIGDEEMIVLLWANEIFDREHPDTIASEV